MKNLLLILILTLSFQYLAKADDIRDFQIEGMSIGDSLLDYFTKEEIQLFINHKEAFFYKNNEFVLITTHGAKKPYKKITGQYAFSGVAIKPSDNQYIIHSLRGTLRFKKNIDNCLIEKNKIVKSISSIFSNSKRKDSDKNHAYDKTGNSKSYATYFYVENGYTSITCTDWSNKLETEKSWYDNLKVSLIDNEYQKFLNTKAFK